MTKDQAAPPQHSPAPWKLTVAGHTWGLARKGARPQDGESDVAQGSTLSERWREDAALIRAAPDMLAALQGLIDRPHDVQAWKAASLAVAKARKPPQ